ncbi:hypothetical protein F442_20383 [Phytophthora nicotianae P10297]|uniref:Uncharacterized protein n=1 Tax=Phytophthora nicotianae P10297 TaxID=1317064 RepID=W2Y6C5_PHYNI|nr:hypothetical protein F442_20383 [Phytophthora nicotianae P10297]
MIKITKMSRRLSMPERHPSKLAFLNDRSGEKA